MTAQAPGSGEKGAGNDRPRAGGRVLPFGRRWHVIHELDLVPPAAEHAELHALCGALEGSADALPERAAREEAEALGNRRAARLGANAGGEQALVERLFGRDPRPVARTLLARIRDEHVAASAHARDLRAALAPGSDDLEPPDEALGYTLRRLLDGCRRAMRFEEVVLFAPGRDRLTPGRRGAHREGASPERLMPGRMRCCQPRRRRSPRGFRIVVRQDERGRMHDGRARPRRAQSKPSYRKRSAVAQCMATPLARVASSRTMRVLCSGRASRASTPSGATPRKHIAPGICWST